MYYCTRCDKEILDGNMTFNEDGQTRYPQCDSDAVTYWRTEEERNKANVRVSIPSRMHIMAFEEAISRFPVEVADQLKTTPQNLEWHPEGCVFNHIKMVFDITQKVAPENIDLQIAALFHDLGKPQTTRTNPDTGKISSPGHERFAKDFIEQYKHLFPEAKDWDKIAFICKNHMKMHLFRQMRPFKRDELMQNFYFQELVLFAFCDDNGRGR